MRWDNLFDDLESQLEQELDAEQFELHAEQERLRLGRLGMRERIAALARNGVEDSGGIRLMLTNGSTLTVQPKTFGKDWLAADLVGAGHGSQCVLALASIASLSLTAAQVETSLESTTEATTGRLIDRIGLPFVLRDLCRRRANLEVTTGSAVIHGTIDRVGRDHIDIAVHEPGTSRRVANVTDHRLIPLQTILFVRV